jgi:hypothetical protein
MVPKIADGRYVANSLDLKGISAENLRSRVTLRKFQVMPEICREISRYAGQEFHLMPELSS